MFSLHDPLATDTRTALKQYDDITAGMLARRGAATAEAAEAFVNPSYDTQLGDPLTMLDMPEAAGRIAVAIDSAERITVWSDYDCDGIPGGVILHDFLKKAGANFDNYIPHRHEEGFGLNIPGIEKLAKAGTKLLISVDCGIGDVAQIRRACELGIDVIIVDHHLPSETLPPAFAIIDPKARVEETYPFKDFCGAGLAWKLVCAVLAMGFKNREMIPEGWEKWLLDMAGLATIADMVPLHGENRVIAKYGLLVMRKSPRVGLQKLCRGCRVNQRFISEDDVGFMIAPRVNAASRMGDPRDAFRLFTTDDEVEADTLAKKLEAANRSRRAAAGAITRAVHARIEARMEPLLSVIAMGDPDWRPALLGLVASGIAETYARPVFLWGREATAIVKGSCRSGDGTHLLELMGATEGTFVEFGGHRVAGGFALQEDAVFFLEERLAQAHQALPPRDGEVVRVDAELSLAEATTTLLKQVERLAPFGMGNAKPVFLFKIKVQKISWFGKSEEHLKLTLVEEVFETKEVRESVEAISFYAKRELGAKCADIVVGNELAIAGSLERDQFAKGQPIRIRISAIA